VLNLLDPPVVIVAGAINKLPEYLIRDLVTGRRLHARMHRGIHEGNIRSQIGRKIDPGRVQGKPESFLEDNGWRSVTNL
jgi:hypothetical protein